MFFRRRKPAEDKRDVEYVRVGRQPIPPKARFEVLRRDNYTCRYCGAKGPEAGGTAVLEIDHRVPVAEGGTNDPVNLVTSCQDCNRGKGATRINHSEDPGRDIDKHQWETCRISVTMGGDNHRQTVTVRADRFGAGQSYVISKPKEFRFQIAVPANWTRQFTWHDYFLLLAEKDKKALQKELDDIERRLKKGGWEQVATQEFRRRVK